MNCPRILIAGTNSGVGKTSITLALAAAFRKRGLKVQTFKVGPDFLDPTYLTIASGTSCFNLDGWMSGKEYVTSLFARTTVGADIAIIEGVMGLFDGSDPVNPEGSAAEIADLLNCPVLLVTNAHGVARSIAALVKGYTEFDHRVKIAGVFANNCGSQRHGEWLAESLKAFNLPELVGALPRGVFPPLPSRHLGLITADQTNLTEETIGAFGVTLERYCDLDKVLQIARSAAEAPKIQEARSDTAPKIHGDIPGPEEQSLSLNCSVTIGIPYDAAFHFYYRDNLEALENNGCKLVYFSPLSDSQLPDGVDALYIGGGYPEEFARELSDNRQMLDSIRRFADAGGLIYAECGGLMYLTQGIETVQGEFFEMAGLLIHKARMLNKRKMLGYVEATLKRDSFFGAEGRTIRGHEFHYSELVGDLQADDGWDLAYSLKYRRSDKSVCEGFQKASVLASYVHLHFASKPECVTHFVRKCSQSRKVEPA